MSNLQMIVIVYGVSFKCVINKLISNCGLSHQPDKLFSYYCPFYGSLLRHLTSSGSKSCYVLW